MRKSQEFRIITVEPRGRGASDPITGPYAFQQHVEDARAVIEAVSTGSVVGIGFSRWSCQLVTLATTYPQLVQKLVLVAGNGNPVSGPYFNLSVPEPTGVVAAIAPQARVGTSLLGLAAVVAPIIVSGNTVVVVPSQHAPLSAISLAEVLATSDVPGGVINVLTGSPAEMAPWLASHADVNALDLTGVAPAARVELERAAAGTVKRVYSPGPQDFRRPPGTARMRAFLEIKTVWHPTGALSLAGGGGY